MVLITLKWNKAVFDKVELDTNSNVGNFKEIIRELTQVPLDRQKLMAKGCWTGFLKDDADFAKMNIKDNQVITLMGTADVLAVPTEKTQFVEDMSEAQKAVAGVNYPAGLINLGNTCYLNSTLQCIRYFPEFRKNLENRLDSADAMSSNFAKSVRELFANLDKSAAPIPPSSTVMQLRRMFPQFAESQQGFFMQQDAEEFYNSLVQVWSRAVPNTEGIFSFEVEQEMQCDEAPQESVTSKKNVINKLVCVIQGPTTAIDHMNEGIHLWLHEKVTKFSSILGRDAVWTGSSKISKVPQYLCVQFMRFFWKETPESQDHAGIKCKILRAVNFPEHLDIFPFCSEAVQKVLRSNRRDNDEEVKKQLLANNPSEAEPATASTTESEGAMIVEDVSDEEEEDEDAAALKAALAMSTSPIQDSVSPSLGGSKVFYDGVPANFTGRYELHSIVTHKGRSADSGHYISFVRQQNSTQSANSEESSSMWWKFDDQTVSEVPTEEIMKLKGGGDRDMSYLVFYKHK